MVFLFGNWRKEDDSNRYLGVLEGFDFIIINIRYDMISSNINTTISNENSNMHLGKTNLSSMLGLWC